MQEVWRQGIARFNSGLFFEAHEAFEDAWREAPRSGLLRRHLQGFVQMAVAFHHYSTGNLVGAGSVLERALRNLDGAEESFPELDFRSLRTSLNAWREYLKRDELRKDMRQPEGTPPELPQLVFHIRSH